MSLLTTAKRVSIATGLYRPARWLSRRLRPHQLRALRDNIELYRSLIPPGALCFDVGANIGEKSEAMLQAGNRVVAFEPNPLVLPELRARCNHHKHWTVVETALGSNAAAFTTLYVRESHAQSGLEQDWEGRIITNYRVPVITLDSAIERFGSPAYCKIDVEGWELEVLRGLTRSIPLVSFEFHLTSSNIQKTISCLERLAMFGPSHVNITPAELATFHFNEWIPLNQFLKWFPGDLNNTLPGNKYGDIFVRSDAA
jgi:FkbM family methyltransferase